MFLSSRYSSSKSSLNSNSTFPHTASASNPTMRPRSTSASISGTLSTTSSVRQSSSEQPMRTRHSFHKRRSPYISTQSNLNFPPSPYTRPPLAQPENTNSVLSAPSPSTPSIQLPQAATPSTSHMRCRSQDVMKHMAQASSRVQTQPLRQQEHTKTVPVTVARPLTLPAAVSDSQTDIHTDNSEKTTKPITENKYPTFPQSTLSSIPVMTTNIDNQEEKTEQVLKVMCNLTQNTKEKLDKFYSEDPSHRPTHIRTNSTNISEDISVCVPQNTIHVVTTPPRSNIATPKTVHVKENPTNLVSAAVQSSAMTEPTSAVEPALSEKEYSECSSVQRYESLSRTRNDLKQALNISSAALEESTVLESASKYVHTIPTVVVPPLPNLSKIRRASSDTCLIRHMPREPQVDGTLNGGTTLLSSAHPYMPRPKLILELPPKMKIEDGQYDIPQSLEFAQRTIDAVNDGATCVLISVGHRLGIFDALARFGGTPRSARTIASVAGLHVRPVEEWLCAMSCSGIVDLRTEVDKKTGMTKITYSLPMEHAVWLTWGGGPGGTAASGTNLGLLCQTVPALGRIEHAVAVSYRKGTGVTRAVYADYERVQAYDVMQTIGVRVLSVLKLSPGLIDELTRGACVFCVSGPADAVYVRLARLFPRSWFTCYGTDELRANMVRKSTEESSVTNVHFKSVSHLEHVHERGSYDVALVLEGSAIRESVDPVLCLRSIRRALHPGASLIYVEMMGAGDVFSDRSHSVATFLYSIAAMYNLPRAIAQGSDGCAAGGIWGHVNVRNAMYDADFSEVHSYPLEDDSLNCVLIAVAPTKR